MTLFTEALRAWGTPAFEAVFKRSVEKLDPAQLPLQRGLATTSYALETEFSVMPLSVVETPGALRVKTGIFYSGVVAGCNCADDPTPVSPANEYCEVWVELNLRTAEATLTLVESA